MSKILVVDDDPDFVLICRMILEAEDYQVLEAANGPVLESGPTIRGLGPPTVPSPFSQVWAASESFADQYRS